MKSKSEKCSSCGAVQEFIYEECEVKKSAWSFSSDLYAGYLDWCDRTGRIPLSQRKFTGEILLHVKKVAVETKIYGIRICHNL